MKYYTNIYGKARLSPSYPMILL